MVPTLAEAPTDGPGPVVTDEANGTPPGPLRPLGPALLAAALALPAVQPAQAEGAPERGSLSLKYLDYLDSQPDADRVRVKAPALSLVLPLGSRWSLAAGAVWDAISGASPAYHTSGLRKLSDYRKAADLGLSHHLDDTSFTLSAAISSEADYLSRALSFSASHRSEDRNTTWTAGLGASHDRINPVTRVVTGERKQVLDAFLGLTQVMGPVDIVQLNLGARRGRGYFSDPYKVFDKRPRERDQATLMLRWNHHWSTSEGSTRLAWRAYADTFRVRAHTLTLEHEQPLAAGFSLTPLLRLYTQSAARFYLDADPSAAPFVPMPPADAEFYSQDQRLSAFGAATLGLKLAWQPHPDWTLDIKVEAYRQRGAWRAFGSGSPDLAPFNARTLQAGLSWSFP